MGTSASASASKIAPILAVAASAAADAPVRGVKPADWPLYAPDAAGNFRCFDNTAIPYSQLNDDYCDCADGSDEPGTSACPNGRFYCANRGFRPKTLYASHVNDGVCDCCDASDEHASGAGCANTCEAEGAEGRKAAAAHLAQVEAGLAEAARRAAAGAAARATARAELDAVVAELAAKRAAAEALEKQKSAAEEVEAKLQEEQRRRKEAEAEAAAASEAAAAEARRAACAAAGADGAGDGECANPEAAASAAETSAAADAPKEQQPDWGQLERDALAAAKGGGGEAAAEAAAAPEDAAEAAEGADRAETDEAWEHEDEPVKEAEAAAAVEAEEELVKDPGARAARRTCGEGWVGIHTHTSGTGARGERGSGGGAVSPGPHNVDGACACVCAAQASPPPAAGGVEDLYGGGSGRGSAVRSAPPCLPWASSKRESRETTSTQVGRARGRGGRGGGSARGLWRARSPGLTRPSPVACAEAERLRAALTVAQGEVSSAEDRERELRKKADADYGAREQFAGWEGACFESKKHGEWTYEVCPFGQAKQKGSDGGSTSLGNWEGFDQGHSVMKFTHGQHCWNGPARSLTVTMRCGGADAVLKVEEPEVCVYAMDMESPAACTDDDLRRAKDDLALFGA